MSTVSPGVCTNCKTANAQYNTILISVNVENEVCPREYFDIGMVKFCTDGVAQATVIFHQLISDPSEGVTTPITIDPVRILLFAHCL